jgi:hypothetical protein
VIRARRHDPSTVRTKMKSPRPARLQERLAWRERTQVKGGDQFVRGRIPEPGGVIFIHRQDPSAVGLNAPYQACSFSGSAKEAISLPEAVSQSLAVVSQHVVRTRAPSGLNAA